MSLRRYFSYSADRRQISIYLKSYMPRFAVGFNRIVIVLRDDALSLRRKALDVVLVPPAVLVTVFVVLTT